ncbi:MAG: hypothetical protein ACREDK_02290 [Thermoplasmata archaeon]
MARRVAPPRPAVSAPDLIGPVSILNWPVAASAPRHHAKLGPLRHVHLEVDLTPGSERTSNLPVLREIEDALREAEVQELGSLISLTGGALHGFAAAGYRQVDHWEIRPGGWLPLHHLPKGPQAVGVGLLLEAMKLRNWDKVEKAREFAGRLSGPGGRRLEFILRRVHRERRHSLSIDLFEPGTVEHVREVVAALSRHLPVLHSSVTSQLHGPGHR